MNKLFGKLLLVFFNVVLGKVITDMNKEGKGVNLNGRPYLQIYYKLGLGFGQCTELIISGHLVQ